MTLFKSLVNRH